MSLLSALATWPLLPVRGAVAVADQVLRQAERDFYNPGSIRRQIEAIDGALERGEVSEDEAAALQDELVERLLEGRARGIS